MSVQKRRPGKRPWQKHRRADARDPNLILREGLALPPPNPNDPRAVPTGPSPPHYRDILADEIEGPPPTDSPRRITEIVGRMILDSRGNPTVEVDCYVDHAHLGRAAVPSGASTGTHEATEIRDGGSKWLGRGVDTAVDNVNGEIRDCLVGMPVDDQEAIDQALIRLDGSLGYSSNKSRLGANAILGASLACFKASFKSVNDRHRSHIGLPSAIASKYRSEWKRNPPTSSPPPQKLSDDEMLSKLKNWRRLTKMAPSHLKPHTLSELATKRPKTKEELPRIRGIGPWITKKFGGEILAIISEGETSDIIPRLPIPLMNILNGGAHAASNVDIQEFMVVPHGFDNFPDALRAGVETYHALKRVLKGRGLLGGVGDEGGFAPDLNTNEDGLRYVVEAIEEAGYTPSEQISIALDCAAQEFFDGDHYHIDGRELTGSELGDLYSKWLEEYPIVSIEDPFGEDDWDSWTEFTEREGHRVQIVGDDIYVTNPFRLQRGIDDSASTAILIKPNQIGTVSQTLEVIILARLNGFRTVISHRSGETSDHFIADLAFWTNAGQIKTGAPARGERTSKYNQLLRISEVHDRYTDDLF